MQHINIASYTYKPTETYIVTHTCIHTLVHFGHSPSSLYTYTYREMHKHSHISIHKHNHMCLHSHACTYTHTNLIRQIKTRKLPLECLRLLLSFWTPLTERSRLKGAMTPHVKLSPWLQKNLNIGWLIWILVSRIMEGLWTLWEASSSFRVRSYWWKRLDQWGQKWVLRCVWQQCTGRLQSTEEG